MASQEKAQEALGYLDKAVRIDLMSDGGSARLQGEDIGFDNEKDNIPNN